MTGQETGEKLVVPPDAEEIDQRLLEVLVERESVEPDAPIGEDLLRSIVGPAPKPEVMNPPARERWVRARWRKLSIGLARIDSTLRDAPVPAAPPNLIERTLRGLDPSSALNGTEVPGALSVHPLASAENAGDTRSGAQSVQPEPSRRLRSSEDRGLTARATAGWTGLFVALVQGLWTALTSPLSFLWRLRLRSGEPADDTSPRRRLGIDRFRIGRFPIVWAGFATAAGAGMLATGALTFLAPGRMNDMAEPMVERSGTPQAEPAVVVPSSGEVSSSDEDGAETERLGAHGYLRAEAEEQADGRLELRSTPADALLPAFDDDGDAFEDLDGLAVIDGPAVNMPVGGYQPTLSSDRGPIPSTRMQTATTEITAGRDQHGTLEQPAAVPSSAGGLVLRQDTPPHYASAMDTDGWSDEDGQTESEVVNGRDEGDIRQSERGRRYYRRSEGERSEGDLGRNQSEPQTGLRADALEQDLRDDRGLERSRSSAEDVSRAGDNRVPGRTAQRNPQSPPVTEAEVALEDHHASEDESAGERRARAEGRFLAAQAEVSVDINRRRSSGFRSTRATDLPPPAAAARSTVRSSRRWLSVRDRVEGARFVEAQGYWQNTYLPGDGPLRWLRRSLPHHENGAQDASGQLIALAQPRAQRFDAPTGSALGLTVRSDRNGIAGRERLRLQVGLSGAVGRTGRRPNLRLVVVVDNRQALDASAQARVRALLTGLSRARGGADRFGLEVAGSHGGLLIPLSDLRYGEVAVALRRTFAGEGGRATDLRAAVQQAIESVAQSDDDAELGTALVLVLSGQLSEGDGRQVAELAQTGALAGVTTTAVSLATSDVTGFAHQDDPYSQIALAGGGRRLAFGGASDADEIIRGELSAVSRIVARSVRLRIRLADGVRLIDVLGSRRLDTEQAARVRRQERAVDRRLARSLGIASDRGEDEDGIQIVIPAFYADDSHVILLDVVANGPGPIADVSARFKDLLTVSNRTLVQRLTLSDRPAAPGPQQREVQNNHLSYFVASNLQRSAWYAQQGRPDQAQAVIASLLSELNGLSTLSGWGGDGTLARDRRLCAELLDALRTSTDSNLWANTMRYAGYRRLHGDPIALDL